MGQSDRATLREYGVLSIGENEKRSIHMETDIKEVLKENLEKVRDKECLTHSQFADRLKINRTSLYLYESGKRVLPTELMYRVWEEFGVTPNELLGIKNM